MVQFQVRLSDTVEAVERPPRRHRQGEVYGWSQHQEHPRCLPRTQRRRGNYNESMSSCLWFGENTPQRKTVTHPRMKFLFAHGKSEYPMVKQKCRQWLIYQLAEHYSFEVPLRDSSRQRVWIGLYSGPKQQRYLRRWPQGRQVRDLCNSFRHFNKWGVSLDVICVKCTHQLIISALKEIWWRPARSASPQLLRLDGRSKE